MCIRDRSFPDGGEDEHLLSYSETLEKNYVDEPDIEAQRSQTDLHAAPSGHEYTIPALTKFLHLGVYFTLNLALVLYNKAILQGVRRTS